MGKNERRACLEAIRERYRTADKKAKTLIPDEFCQVCGYNRTSAIRLLGQQRTDNQASVIVIHIYKS